MNHPRIVAIELRMTYRRVSTAKRLDATILWLTIASRIGIIMDLWWGGPATSRNEAPRK